MRAPCLLAPVLLLVHHAAQAQAPREPLHSEIIAKIKEEGLNRSQAMETISFLTDVHGPRLTNSPLLRAAAEWTKGRLASWGLENVHYEPWGPFGSGWSLEHFSVNMIQPSYSPIIAFPKAWSPSTPMTIRGQPVLLEVASEADLEKYRGKLRRAIVLFSGPRDVKALFDPPARRQTDASLLALANADPAASRTFPRPPSSAAPAAPSPSAAAAPSAPSSAVDQRAASQLLARKWQFVYEEGAAVVLEPGRGDGGTVFVGAVTLPTAPPPAGESRPAAPSENPYSRGPRPWTKDPSEIVPQVVVAVEHYNRLIRTLQKGAPVELEIDIASRFHADDPTCFNIVAEIPGGDLKDEIVMLGGHFDSWHSGTGATDNAVGCGVALEAVRILSAIEARPRRTVRLALWTGEEQGLLGSRAYVGEHFGKAITPPASQSAGGRRGAADESKSAGSKRGSGPTRTSQAQRPNTKYELKPAHEKFCAYFNLDNGTGKIRGVYLQGNEAVRPIFRAWLGPFADMGALTLAPGNTGGTDHLSFDGVGLPGFQFIQDPLEYDSRTHHSNMDVFDRLQADDVKQAAVIMASFVYHAAMRDEKLPRKPLAGEIIRLDESSAKANVSAADR